MIRSVFARICLSLCLVPGSLLGTACSGEPPQDSTEAATTGTFSMPLLASAGSHTYRLQGSMWISGPLYTYLDLSADTDVATTALPTGNYNSSLNWWTLSRDDGTGNFEPVNATLVSSGYASFSIFNQATTTLSFQFETDGQLITVGSGSLHVAVDVEETPPVCAPLGGDCAPGTWCAPPELTGAVLACISEGPVAVGEPCSSPLDCVGNSSCFDFGSGAVCTPLCSGAELGLECVGGGLCTPQGVDYGVCAPTP